MGAPPAPSLTEVTAYLKLTDAQVTSLTAIRQAEATANRTTMQDIQTKQKALHDALSSGKADALTLGNLLLDIQALQKKIADSHTSTQTQAVAVLTEAQKPLLKALQDAANLQPTIQQAGFLGLLTPPAGAGPGMGPMMGGPSMMGGPGMMGGHGAMPMGGGPGTTGRMGPRQ
jgi:hypothetical protein